MKYIRELTNGAIRRHGNGLFKHLPSLLLDIRQKIQHLKHLSYLDLFEVFDGRQYLEYLA